VTPEQIAAFAGITLGNIIIVILGHRHSTRKRNELKTDLDVEITEKIRVKYDELERLSEKLTAKLRTRLHETTLNYEHWKQLSQECEDRVADFEIKIAGLRRDIFRKDFSMTAKIQQRDKEITELKEQARQAESLQYLVRDAFDKLQRAGVRIDSLSGDIEVLEALEQQRTRKESVE